MPAKGESSRRSANTSAMRVKWLRGALRNLHQAVDYIAQDNPVAVSDVAAAIWEAAIRLEQHPHMGRDDSKGRVNSSFPDFHTLFVIAAKLKRSKSCRFITWRSAGLKTADVNANKSMLRPISLSRHHEYPINRRVASGYDRLSKMIETFKDEATEDIFNGKNTKAARKACPASLW